MSHYTYLLTVEADSHAEVSHYTEELRNALLDASSEIDVQTTFEGFRAEGQPSCVLRVALFHL